MQPLTTPTSSGNQAVPPNTVHPQMLQSNQFMMGPMVPGGEGAPQNFQPTFHPGFMPPPGFVYAPVPMSTSSPMSVSSPENTQLSTIMPENVPRQLDNDVLMSPRNHSPHPIPSSESTMFLPAGRWLAKPHLGTIIHEHADHSPCTNLFQHQCVAFGTRDPGFMKALEEQVNNHREPVLEDVNRLRKQRNELQESNTRMQKELEILQNEVIRVQTELEGLQAKQRTPQNPPKSSAGSKRKQNEAESMEVDQEPPAKRPAPEDTPVAAIGFTVFENDSQLRGPGIDLTLMEYSGYRPGFPDSYIKPLQWWENSGHFKVPTYIHSYARTAGSFPSPISAVGTPLGAQIPPTTSAELATLSSQSQVPGNWAALQRVQVIRSLAGLLQHLHLMSNGRVPALSGVMHESLSLNSSPGWESHTLYVDFVLYCRSDDREVLQDTSKAVQAPKLPSTPGPEASDIQWAEGAFVYFIHNYHYGLMMSDSGFIDMTSVRAFRLYVAMSPDNASDSNLSHYRSNFITLVANIHLYAEIVESDHLVIEDHRSITPCRKEDVKSIRALAAHFAKCGLSIAEINSYVYFGMKYCLDLCKLKYLKYNLRRKYASIFISAQYRTLFFPLPLPTNDTYQLPSHWDLDQIKEYRRRQAVVRRWKDSKNSGPPPVTEVLKTTYDPRPPANLDLGGVSQLTLSETPSDSANQSTPTSSQA
ncbi:hypothetical protein VNI00_012198 [Paramarasmius palmivorus]|uniref:Uncharacterized protein n=1 Tax=Paramarasmius palmivorus TaxID=297713 RepID=A0AAW0C738_9AGAR